MATKIILIVLCLVFSALSIERVHYAGTYFFMSRHSNRQFDWWSKSSKRLRYWTDFQAEWRHIGCRWTKWKHIYLEILGIRTPQNLERRYCGQEQQQRIRYCEDGDFINCGRTARQEQSDHQESVYQKWWHLCWRFESFRSLIDWRFIATGFDFFC